MPQGYRSLCISSELECYGKKTMNMAMTPLEEAAYALDNGLPRRDLAPEVQAAYDRLAGPGCV